MIIAIHQPQFLPWLGYFDKIIKADTFCYLDNVQYKKNEWQNRNRIKTINDTQWVTVPVHYRFPQKVKEVKINNNVNWRRKHLQAFITNYGKAPYFSDYFDMVNEIYTREWEWLSELNIHIIEKIIEILNLKQKTTILASEMDLSDDPTDRLIDICKSLKGDTYLSGPSGENYMNLRRFKERKVDVIYQYFTHPEYPQLFGGFKSHLSILDMLFNCGPETIQILRGTR